MLFAIFDPLGSVPIFLSLTAKMSESQRKKVIKQSLTFAFALLVAFAYFGWWLLSFLGITFNDFKIAGGLLLLVLAVEDMVLERRRYRMVEAEELAFVPLGTPLLAGPGSLVTVMILMKEFNLPVAFLAIVSNTLLAWVIFRTSEKLSTYLGKTGLRVIMKIMGLIIISFAVKFIREGISDAFLT
jgi:multiple antibiotic resistance protein